MINFPTGFLPRMTGVVLGEEKVEEIAEFFVDNYERNPWILDVFRSDSVTTLISKNVVVIYSPDQVKRIERSISRIFNERNL